MPTTAVTPAKPLPPDLQRALARLGEINSLPEVTTKIVQVVEDPRATAHDMHEIIEADPALAAKILKVVNSAFYGLSSQIASLDRAIVMLGLSATKNIALAASLSRMFRAEAVSDQFAARDLWRHCAAVAVCARLLANTGKATQPDEAFVAGLVHDMGLMAVQQLYPAKLKEVVERCHSRPLDFSAVELSLIGADHQAFGGALVAKWKFPLALRAAVSYHHSLSLAPPEFQKLTTTIYAADVLSCRGRFGLWLTPQMQEITDTELKVLNLTPTDLDRVVEEMPERVDEAERVFLE